MNGSERCVNCGGYAPPLDIEFGGCVCSGEYCAPWMNAPNVPPVHLVRSWSGKSSDETPLCGVDRNATEVFSNRTIYLVAVSCPNCLREIKKLAEVAS